MALKDKDINLNSGGKVGKKPLSHKDSKRKWKDKSRKEINDK